MTPTCPECQAVFEGKPAPNKAARVCKACGHAFLLHPDGTTESLKKKPKPEPVVEAAPAPPPQEEAPPPELPPAEPAAPPAMPDLPPEPDPVPPPVVMAPPMQPPVMPPARAAPRAPERKGSSAIFVLLPLVLIAGAGLGYGTRFVPALAPKPPPAPTPVASHQPAAPPTKFTTADEPLWSGPLSTPPYAQIAVLPKGSAVVATNAEIGSFVLVRDAMGRGGFVRSAALADKRPAAPFVDCAHAPFEAEDACRARAGSQLEACKAVCADPACGDGCKKSFDECVPGCAHAGLSAQAPPPDPEPVTTKKKGKVKAKKKGKGGKSKGGATDDGPWIPTPEPEN